ncbi:hypothetical protein ACA910_006694 [Epithemia clementina (nom. ined.)]
MEIGDNASADSDGPSSLSFRVLYSTQSGRSKACARRASRLLMEQLQQQRVVVSRSSSNSNNTEDHKYQQKPLLLKSCDEDFVGHGNNLQQWADSLKATTTTNAAATWLVLFISTTGDGEHTDTIQCLWKQLLHKSVPPRLLQGVRFSLFGLGDRAYGPQFCAAARKLAVRFVQLGAQLVGEPGYGDDGTPGGGVFVDLDVWLQSHLFPAVIAAATPSASLPNNTNPTPLLQPREPAACTPKTIRPNSSSPVLPYQIKVLDSSYILNNNDEEEWSHVDFREAYQVFLESRRPVTAYHYGWSSEKDVNHNPKQHGDYLVRREKSSASNGLLTTTTTKTETSNLSTLLLGRIVNNQRLTADDWIQDTRHLRLEIERLGIDDHNNTTTSSNNNTTAYRASRKIAWDLGNLPYRAGDVVSILPSNSKEEVDRFLSVLPQELQIIAHRILEIHPPFSTNDGDDDDGWNRPTGHKNNCISVADSFVCYNHWPVKCTLYGWLMYCADIHALPEREDLWALSHCCSLDHAKGQAQREKLQQLSQSTGSALYTDYILREKRNWTDVLYDFDSLRASSSTGNQVLHLSSLPILMSLLSPIRPREFSIASSPSKEYHDLKHGKEHDSNGNGIFGLDLCVAVVEGKTPLGRSYHGFCSDYLCRRKEERQTMCCWIRPGSFQQLPLSLSGAPNRTFQEPVLYIGAGTGIAPLRSLIYERRYVHLLLREQKETTSPYEVAQIAIEHRETTCTIWDKDDILIFGCRKKSADFYYQDEWEAMKPQLGLLTAFSQDQWHKIYVQSVLKTSDPMGANLMTQLKDHNGSIYIAGGAKMARAVKDEIVELLSKVQNSKSAEQDATSSIKQWLAKLQRQGRFRVEAWS